MAKTARSPVERLFGSAIRARVLGYLAESRAPRTGYEISKVLGAVPAKVYNALRLLEPAGFIRAVPGRARSRRFVLVDEDLRSFLLRRIRIATEAEWFAPDRVRQREEALMRARALTVPLPRGPARPKDLPNYREFIRLREKDLVVRKVIARRSHSR